MSRTRFGLEIRAIGGDAEASRRLGIPVSAYMIATMAAAGGAAGLAGMAEVSAIQGRLVAQLSPGYGFMGFLVAWLAGGGAVGIVVMAFVFAVLSSIGDVLQITQGVPFSVINLLMAAILFIVLVERGKGGAAMSPPFFVAALSSAILSGTSLLYATLGELVGERAGIVNLGLEGLMLIGAATGFAAASPTLNPYLGVARGGGRRRRRQLYLRLRRDLPTRQPAGGGTEPHVLRPRRKRPDRPPVRRRARRRPAASGRLRRPGLARAADRGAALGRSRSAPAGASRCARSARRRRWRSPPGAAPDLMQYQALVVAGALGGVAGAHLSLAVALTWDEGMTAGRGFIAIALVIFARWNPLWAVVGALIFGGAEVAATGVPGARRSTSRRS